MSGLPVPSSEFTYKRVAGTNPAAGIEMSDAVPANRVWWLLGVSVPLVQGLTQTPQPVLLLDDGANIIYAMPGSTAAQAVSTTCQYSWGGDLQITGQIGSAAAVYSAAPLPQNLMIPAGYRIRTSTIGIGANSDYGVPSYYVCEFIVG